MAQVTPDWIKNLPKGAYQIKELSEKLHLDCSNITRQLLKHGAKREAKILHKSRNLVTYIYYWDGLK